MANWMCSILCLILPATISNVLTIISGTIGLPTWIPLAYSLHLPRLPVKLGTVWHWLEFTFIWVSATLWANSFHFFGWAGGVSQQACNNKCACLHWVPEQVEEPVLPGASTHSGYGQVRSWFFSVELRSGSNCNIQSIIHDAKRLTVLVEYLQSNCDSKGPRRTKLWVPVSARRSSLWYW